MQRGEIGDEGPFAVRADNADGDAGLAGRDLDPVPGNAVATQVTEDLATERICTDVSDHADRDAEARQGHGEVPRLPRRGGNMARSRHLLTPRWQLRHAPNDQVNIEIADHADRTRAGGAGHRVTGAAVMTTPHFTAPSVRPRVRPRRTKSVQITIGSIIRLAAAVMYPQSMPVSRTNDVTATGRVWDR